MLKKQHLLKKQRLSRRDVLKLVGLGLGGALLACRQNTNPTPQPVLPPDSPLATATSLPAQMAAPLAQVSPVVQPGQAILPAGAGADTLFLNGRVFTVDAANSIAQAIAIQGDKILQIGSDQEMRLLTAENTRIFDLRGRAVTPGLIDPHLHFRVWGLQETYYTPFMPPDVNDISGLQRILADSIKGRPAGEWIMGFYLALGDKMIPTKEDLDPVSKDNPVFLMHIGGHWGTANSAAMQIAKISNSTPSPEGGIIEKVDGELTGVFYNHRAMDVLRVYAPPIDLAQIRTAILETQTVMAACGMTAFHDNNVRGVDHIRAYQELSQEGKLFLRNDLYLTLEWPSDIDKVVQVQPLDSAVTRFAGYKFLIDGQGPTAFCHQPHNGAEYRLSTWAPQIFKDTIKSLHNTGLQICVHCVGDAAADLTLEAYEAAQNANPRSDPRHRIEHAILTTPAATQKMKDLGVVVCTQPAFIYLFGESWNGLYGPERMERILVTREWLEAGLHMAISSDAPSTPLYWPAATLAGSMSRYTIRENTIGADQVLSFPEALRAHTYEAAFSGHHEAVTGSLETGKLADLVVWPSDISQISIGQLAKVNMVDLTMVGGKVVYEKDMS